MKAFALLSLVLISGCSHHPPPDVMVGTHKVWLDQEYLTYENEDGFGCGNITRTNRGWVYEARVINWKDESVDSRSLHSYWNNFQDAERFVEKWCKP